jgi:hypothetical protein
MAIDYGGQGMKKRDYQVSVPLDQALREFVERAAEREIARSRDKSGTWLPRRRATLS